MKNFRTLFLLFLSISLAVACSDDDDDKPSTSSTTTGTGGGNNGGTTGAGTKTVALGVVEADISGTTTRFDSTSAILASGTINIVASILDASGNPTQTISIGVDKNSGLGTFDIINDPHTVAYTSSTAVFLPTSGTVVVNKLDTINKQVSGNFNYVGSNFIAGGSITVSNGAYNMTYF